MAHPLAALRIIAWTLLLSATLPRLASRGGRPNAPGDVATGALALALAAWLTRSFQLTSAALLVALTLVLAWLFGRLSRPSPHKLTRRFALTLAGLFQGTETPRPKLPHAVSVREAVRHELALPGRVAGRWSRRLVVALGRRGGMGVALVAACVTGVTVESLVAFGPAHLIASEDLVTFTARALAGDAEVAVCAAVVLAAWSGAALLRRLRPGSPAAFGALALAAPLVVASLRGAVAPIDAVVASALPWAFVPTARPRSVRDVWALPVLLGVLHPAAGALAACLVFARAVLASPGDRSRAGLTRVALCVASAIVALGLWRSSSGAAGGGFAWASVALCALAVIFAWRGSRAGWRGRRLSLTLCAVAGGACAAVVAVDARSRASGLVAVVCALGALGVAAGFAEVWWSRRQRRGTVSVSPARRRTYEMA